MQDSYGAITSVKFEQKFFTSVDGSYFRKSPLTEEPVFILNLGGEEITLPIKGICREFGIKENSADFAMLEMVAAGLDYVKILMPGDTFPKELLTGEASWDVSAEHRTIAKQRVCMKLVSWVSGDENRITEPRELIRIADDPQIKAKINAAFEQAAAALDNPNATRDMVVDLIEELAYELAYIEKLRDRFRSVLAMEAKVKRVRHASAKQRSLLDTATSVTKLTSIAAREFEREFALADGQTNEIISMLQNIHAQKEYIRGVRDSVNRRMVAWDDVLRAWDRQSGIISADTPDLMRDTYRFLAPRYMQTDDWLLAAQVKQTVDIEKIGSQW
ncbi:MAG: hypothetical protein WD767_00100 [Alphaproteobacteria bacterium]